MIDLSLMKMEKSTLTMVGTTAWQAVERWCLLHQMSWDYIVMLQELSGFIILNFTAYFLWTIRKNFEGGSMDVLTQSFMALFPNNCVMVIVFIMF